MAVIAALSALVAARPLRDNSFLTHLATGRLILAEGIPSENPFLYTGTDFPVPSWWWSVLLAAAEDLGGATGIRLLTALVAAVLGVVLVRLTRRTGDASTSVGDGPVGKLDVVDGGEDVGNDDLVVEGRGPALVPIVVPTALALVCTFDFLNGRPHLAGFVLLALVVLVVHEDRSPWWLVALFAAWVNVHGSWVYGLVVLGLLHAARAIDDRRLGRGTVTAALAALGGVLVGGALYPRPFEIVLLPTRQFGDPLEREALQAYAEWAGAGFDRPMTWALLVLGAVAAWGAARSRRWAGAALVVALVVMGLSSMRLVPVAAITLVPFAAAALAGRGSVRMPTGAGARVLTASGAVLALVTVGYSAAGDGYDLSVYPVEAVDWLEERDLVATTEVHVVAPAFVGNYLEWRYGTDAAAYVDDRPDAATLIDYRRLARLEPGWQDALTRARADVVLWGADQRLPEALAGDSGWVHAVERDGFSVLCRTEVAERCS